MPFSLVRLLIAVKMAVDKAESPIICTRSDAELFEKNDHAVIYRIPGREGGKSGEKTICGSIKAGHTLFRVASRRDVAAREFNSGGVCGRCLLIRRCFIAFISVSRVNVLASGTNGGASARLAAASTRRGKAARNNLPN